MRSCPSFPGYSVSADGKVFSHRKRVGRGYVIDTDYIRELEGHVGYKGYRSVGISVGRKVRVVRVHVLVADAFHGPRPEGLETRHLDGNPLNNAAENLKYGTALENYEDQVRHGTAANLTIYQQGGESNPSAKLKDRQVPIIRELYRCGMSINELAALMDMSECAMSKLVRGHSWKNVENAA